MYTAEYKGINSFLVGASTLLLNEGVKRKARNKVCVELPEPFLFKITNPTARLVTIEERKWNPILPFAESLWLATGRNDLDFIGYYLKNMIDFSDDGEFLSGGYGPRLRKFNGINDDYKVRNHFNVDISCLSKSQVDQFSFVCKTFEQDIYTRQAIINIGDPPKDCINKDGQIKATKDFPCTRILNFQKQSDSNKLNLTVYMRSNDIVWGASAVNIFNFTFMLEYFAQILNMEIGDYYHIANNFHYYEEFEDKIKAISKITNPIDIGFQYTKKFNSLTEFDKNVNQIRIEEEKLRSGIIDDLIDFNDDFFNDWYKAFYVFNTRKKASFSNPILNKLFKKYMTNG